MHQAMERNQEQDRDDPEPTERNRRDTDMDSIRGESDHESVFPQTPITGSRTLGSETDSQLVLCQTSPIQWERKMGNMDEQIQGGARINGWCNEDKLAEILPGLHGAAGEFVMDSSPVKPEATIQSC